MTRVPANLGTATGRFSKPTIIWNGPAFTRQLREDVFRGLTLGTQLLRRKIVRRISKSAVTKRGAVSPSKRARRPRVLTHSKPGEPPRAISGKLRQSIFASVSRVDMVGTVGTKVDHGVAMELGVKKSVTITPKRKKVLVFGVNGMWVFTKRVRRGPIAPRPYIVSTMKMNQRQISITIFGPIRRRLGMGTLLLGR